jgi:MYXO-CTERM domain-containing protein
MRKRTHRLLATTVFCFAALAETTAVADTLITEFENFNLTGTYEAWTNPTLTTITSGPMDFTVASRGFGGGYFDINPQINAAGETLIQLSVTVDAASSLPGVILALVDGDGTLHNYAWYGLADGNHILTKTIGQTSFGGEPGSVPGLDVSTMDFFHIQVDGGAPYRVSYNTLKLVPEPSATTLAAIGLVGLTLGRRRRTRG